MFCRLFSLLVLFLNLCGSSHGGIPLILEFIRPFEDFLTTQFISWSLWVVTLGHTPILEFIGSFADSLTTRSTSWSLWVVTLGHTPHPWVHQVFCVLSHCSIYFLIFVSRHTRAYPFSAWLGAFPSLWVCHVSCWFHDCQTHLSIFMSYHLGRPPTVILFRASPFCHLV